MCAQTARLSDRQLKAVKPKDKDYVLTDGDGLQLRVRVNRSMQWNFNYRHPITKNRINMALGSYPEVSLAQARRKAVDAREVLAQGIDPKAQRNDLAQAKLAETEHTFEKVATAWFELKKGLGHAGLCRGHLALTHAARFSEHEIDSDLGSQRPDGDQDPSPHRSQGQLGNREAA